LYVDLIWLLNWLFDCLLLYWTSVLMKIRPKLLKLILGGLVGSIIIILSFSSFYAVANNVLIKVIFSAAMIWIVFGYTRMSTYIKTLMLFYFVTFLSGGILLGVHFLFQSEISLNSNMFYGLKIYGDPISWLFVIIGFPLGWHFSKRNFQNIEMTNISFDQLVKVRVKIKDLEIECKGLVDSGNQLYEPFTGIPVMVLSANNIIHFPEDIKKLILNKETWLKTGEFIESQWSDRMRIVPYKVVGHDQEMLLAFRPDYVIITTENKQITVKKVLVSITLQQLSADHHYEALIHPQMLTAIPNSNAS
jgi:stage II sporulation protein GA (sporulation sigma-E factor processing peptidase)